MDVNERLAQLEKLRQEGAISDEEYLQQKAMIEDERSAAAKVDALAEEAASKAAVAEPEPVEAPAVAEPEPPAAPQPAAAPAKTPMELAEARERKANIAMGIEIVFGLFMLLGLGHIYGGFVGAGLARLVGWILLWIVGTAAFAALLFDAGFVVGLFGLCLLPLIMGAYIAVPIWSGFKVKSRIMSGG